MMDGQVKSFRDLIVWQKAMTLATGVFNLTRGFPKEETYGLAAQIRRCSVSIASNIAEGHGRLSAKEYRQFLGIARGSNFELQTQLEIAKNVMIGDQNELELCMCLSHEVGKMIYAIIDALVARD